MTAPIITKRKPKPKRKPPSPVLAALAQSDDALVAGWATALTRGREARSGGAGSKRGGAH